LIDLLRAENDSKKSGEFSEIREDGSQAQKAKSYAGLSGEEARR
jgi:hypothetical protein